MSSSNGDAETPLESCELPVRVFNALKNAGFNTVRQVKTLSDAELLRHPNIGRGSVKLIRLATQPRDLPAVFQRLDELESRVRDLEAFKRRVLSAVQYF